MDAGNAGGAAETSWQKVALTGELLPDRPCGAVVGGVELVLVHGGGGLRAYQAQCPHQGTLLSEGEIVKGQLVCRAHGWRFDLATG
jgi:nitrite reductase/ring-hydroxylating ferredoxin subunit